MPPVDPHDGVRAEVASFGQPADFFDHYPRRIAPYHQHPGFLGSGVREAVDNASRHEHKTSSPQPFAPSVEEKFHNALDDESGFVIAAVQVWGRSWTPWWRAALKYREVRGPGLHLDRATADPCPERTPLAGT